MDNPIHQYWEIRLKQVKKPSRLTISMSTSPRIRTWQKK
jgi:hypothetical protein